MGTRLLSVTVMMAALLAHEQAHAHEKRSARAEHANPETSAPGDRIAEIRIEGCPSGSREAAEGCVRSQPGHRLDRALIEGDRRRLLDTKRFSQVESFLKEDRQGQIVIFRLKGSSDHPPATARDLPRTATPPTHQVIRITSCPDCGATRGD